MDKDAVFMQFQNSKETEEVMPCAKDKSSSSFFVVERLMEVLGPPPRPQWVKMSGVPMHAWGEGVFLLGDYLGQTMEVDCRTISKEVISHGRVRVMLKKVRKLPNHSFASR